MKKHLKKLYLLNNMSFRKKNKGVSLVELLVGMTLSFIVIGMAFKIYLDIKTAKNKIEHKADLIIKKYEMRYLFETILNKNGMGCLIGEHYIYDDLSNKSSLLMMNAYPEIFSYNSNNINLSQIVNNSNIQPDSDFMMVKGAYDIQSIKSYEKGFSVDIYNSTNVTAGDLILICTNSFVKPNYTLAEVSNSIDRTSSIPLTYDIGGVINGESIGRYGMYVLFTAYTNSDKTESSLFLYSLSNTHDISSIELIKNVSDLHISYYNVNEWVSSNTVSIETAKNIWRNKSVKGIKIKCLVDGKDTEININMNKIRNSHAI